MRKKLPIFGVLCAIFLFLLLISRFVTPSNAAATHIVISEIRTEDSIGSNSADFIELYNPTNSEINIGDLRLVKRTNTGDTDSSIVSFTAGEVIPARGYYLWCNTVLSTTFACDASSTATIANNNSIGLRQDPAQIGELIDSVTIGTPLHPLGEGAFLTNPTGGKTLERKAFSTSTALSMTTGADALMGNGEDTNNNANDFILRNFENAQNAVSAIEPEAVSPTATLSPTLSPTVTPTNTPTPSPTVTHTPTPTITLSPTMSPTSSPTMTPTKTPTPTLTPTSSPTSSPSPAMSMTPTATKTPTPTSSPTVTPTKTPSPTMSVSVTPSVILTPTPTPPFVIPTYKLVCSTKTLTFSVLFRNISISYPICNVVQQ